jgi:hypothetical protein
MLGKGYAFCKSYAFTREATFTSEAALHFCGLGGFALKNYQGRAGVNNPS